jgi:hypothetical protein
MLTPVDPKVNRGRDIRSIGSLASFIRSFTGDTFESRY